MQMTRAPPPTLPPMMPFTPIEVGFVVVDNTIADVAPMVAYGIATEARLMVACGSWIDDICRCTH